MVFVVNCQNGYLEKCSSEVLRNIVEVADLMDDVFLTTWTNPPVSSFYRPPDAPEMNMEYEKALYPELDQLGRRVHAMQTPYHFSQEIHSAIKGPAPVYFAGANTDNWMVKMAMEIWTHERIRPVFIYDAWFTVGPKGAHAEAIRDLNRQFGAGIFKDWESLRAPILKKREELARAFGKIVSSDPPPPMV